MCVSVAQIQISMIMRKKNYFEKRTGHCNLEKLANPCKHLNVYFGHFLFTSLNEDMLWKQNIVHDSFNRQQVCIQKTLEPKNQRTWNLSCSCNSEILIHLHNFVNTKVWRCSAAQWVDPRLRHNLERKSQFVDEVKKEDEGILYFAHSVDPSFPHGEQSSVGADLSVEAARLR